MSWYLVLAILRRKFILKLKFYLLITHFLIKVVPKGKIMLAPKSIADFMLNGLAADKLKNYKPHLNLISTSLSREVDKEWSVGFIIDVSH